MEMKTTITITSRIYDVADKELNKLFDELVPATGKADTKAGEIIRAMARVEYRYFNDGDIFGRGYGKQTVNPAGRYLCDKLPEIADTLWGLYGCWSDDEYEKGLLNVVNYAIDYVLAHPELKEEPNDEDFFDWRDEDEDVDDTDEEEEEW